MQRHSDVSPVDSRRSTLDTRSLARLCLLIDLEAVDLGRQPCQEGARPCRWARLPAAEASIVVLMASALRWGLFDHWLGSYLIEVIVHSGAHFRRRVVARWLSSLQDLIQNIVLAVGRFGRELGEARRPPADSFEHHLLADICFNPLLRNCLE